MTELPDDELRKTTVLAFSAYNAMETTKRRHFDYLNLLEAKRKKFNLEATSKERDLLASLLADHNLAVTGFKAQAEHLKRTAPDAHLRLFQYIGCLNEVFDDLETASKSSH